MNAIRHYESPIFGQGWIETFDCADEIIQVCARREIHNSRYSNFQESCYEDFTNVKSYDEACTLMREGFEQSVAAFEKGVASSLVGCGKRISFFNDVVGYAPIVPLAIMGVPQSMSNSYMKPIKAKVLDVYCNMSVSTYVSIEDIQKCGSNLLAAIIQLEQQGYKFNIFATQEYANGSKKGRVDFLCLRVKNSNTPLDLRKLSFPLTHPAYLRVIGFDWYTRFPECIYLSGMGTPMGHVYSEQEIAEGFRHAFGPNAIAFDMQKMLNKDSEHIQNVLTNKQTKD